MAQGQGVKIGLLCSRVRVEEKLLLAALRARDAAFDRIDPRKLTVDLQGGGQTTGGLDQYDAVMVRCRLKTRAAMPTCPGPRPLPSVLPAMTLFVFTTRIILNC